MSVQVFLKHQVLFLLNTYALIDQLILRLLLVPLPFQFFLLF